MVNEFRKSSLEFIGDSWMINVLLLLMFFIILQLHNRCGYTAPSLQSSPQGNNGMGSHADWFLIIPRLWLHADNNKDINFN